MLALAVFPDILSTRTSGGNDWRDGVRNHAANSRANIHARLFSPVRALCAVSRHVEGREAMTRKIGIGAILCAMTATLTLGVSETRAVEDFYKGKTINVVIGYPTGGSYDIYMRTVMRHMGRHLPGAPGFVPMNMPGAGSLRAANHLFNVAPRDGATLGVFGRGIPFEPLFGNKAAKFDALKFTWIGSVSDEVSICAAWHTTGVTSFKQVRDRELIIGASSAGADSVVFPTVLNAVLGTRFKIIPGYVDGDVVALAMERGELQGRCGWSWSAVRTQTPHLLQEPMKINVLVQLGLNKHADLKHVPLVMELAQTDEQRELLTLIFARQSMAYPLIAPPQVPADRAEALRAAFDATMKDKDFLAAAKASKLDVNPTTGKEILRLIEQVYSASPDLIARARKAAGVK